MNGHLHGHSHRPADRAEEDSLDADAAARRLREEMETALRHLREQAWGLRALGEPDHGRPDGDDA